MTTAMEKSIPWTLVSRQSNRVTKASVKVSWRQVNLVYRHKKEEAWLLKWIEENEKVIQKVLAKHENRKPIFLNSDPKKRKQAAKQARSKLEDRVFELAKHAKLKINKLSFRSNSSRWGSCSSLGNISLNVGLLELPAKLQDYVIQHELAHIKHRDHSKAYWKFLESICPNSRILDKKLNEYLLVVKPLNDPNAAAISQKKRLNSK